MDRYSLFVQSHVFALSNSVRAEVSHVMETESRRFRSQGRLEQAFSARDRGTQRRCCCSLMSHKQTRSVVCDSYEFSLCARESAAVVLTAMVFSVILRQQFSLHSVHTWIAVVCVGKVTLRKTTAYRLRLCASALRRTAVASAVGSRCESPVLCSRLGEECRLWDCQAHGARSGWRERPAQGRAVKRVGASQGRVVATFF